MYEHHAIADMDEIPALVGAFATALGWTVTGTTDAPILTAPGDSLPWTVSSPINDMVRVSYLNQDSNSAFLADVDSDAIIHSPVINTSFSTDFATYNVTQQPTAVHLIGALDPEPYIHIVAQYGNNSFRHLYIGFMERIGTYTGGHVIASTNGPQPNANAENTYKDYDYMQYLFQSRTGRPTTVEGDGGVVKHCGGVLVSHVDNDFTWRRFQGLQSPTPFDEWPDATAIGGFGDSVNDGYLARARVPFAGVDILVPINLYVIDQIVADVSIVPIGRPAGIRMVNMQDLEPATEIVVGGIRWMVFPAISKRIEKTMPRGGSGFGTFARRYESSCFVGYAISIGEEDSNS